MCVRLARDLVLENLDLPDMIAKRFATGPCRQYRDEVRQVAAMAMVEASQKLPASNTNPRGFFYQRMKWRVRDWYRDMPREVASVDSFADDPPVSPVCTEREALRGPMRDAIRDAIGALPKRWATVVSLRFGLDGPRLKYEEVSQLLGINVNTVKGIQLRALERLALKLKEWL